jgi:Raf kinase inhibitor-like YbhB/YbcL family protein
MNNANQVVAQRGTGPAVFLDRSQVTRIVYEGGEGTDTFRNNTNISSSFPNRNEQEGDVHTEGVNANPITVSEGFQLTSNFTNGLPQSSASGVTVVGGQRIGNEVVGGQRIGENIHPSVTWKNIPLGTQSLVLVMKDTTPNREIVPTGDYTHSVTYDIPQTTREIRGTAGGGVEGLDRSGTRTFYISPGNSSAGETGPRLGVDGFNNPGYNGPNPTDGKEHVYVWTLYALNTDKLQLPAGAKGTSAEVEKAIKPNIIGQTSIRGTFTMPAGTQSEFVRMNDAGQVVSLPITN